MEAVRQHEARPEPVPAAPIATRAAVHPVHELQRRIGNRATTRLLQRMMDDADEDIFAAPAAHPTGIRQTALGDAMAYGSQFRHTIESSDGNPASLAGQVVHEDVVMGRNDFGFGAPEVGDSPIAAGGVLTDNIETPEEEIDERLADVDLPAYLETPQTLSYESAPGVWTVFANVAMRFTLREAQGAEVSASGLVCLTRVNGVEVIQPYRRELAEQDPGWA